MENLLLVLDDLDDAVGVARHLAPRLLGLLAVLVLVGLTVMSFLFAPWITLGAIGVLLSIVLLDRVGRRLLATPLKS